MHKVRPPGVTFGTLSCEWDFMDLSKYHLNLNMCEMLFNNSYPTLQIPVCLLKPKNRTPQ